MKKGIHKTAFALGKLWNQSVA